MRSIPAVVNENSQETQFSPSNENETLQIVKTNETIIRTNDKADTNQTFEELKVYTNDTFALGNRDIN